MFFLQTIKVAGSIGYNVIFSTLVMVIAAGVTACFVVYYQRNVIKANENLRRMEADKRASLIRASIKFQEDERNRIAADLHDDAGPLLATIRLYLNETMLTKNKADLHKSILSARQIVDDTIALIRNISHSLLPPTLKNFGLDSGVANLYQKINNSGKIATTVTFNDYDERLSPERELLCFRVIQEVVNNVIKHSYVSFIHLIQTRIGENIYIIIQHDGKGIVQSEFDKLLFESKGLGLKNIENRMHVLGGRISFEVGKDDKVYKTTIEVPMVREGLSGV